MTGYNRWLPPPTSPAAPELIAEARRRELGPICAQCVWCPWDERELPRLVPSDDRPTATSAAVPVLEFHCDAVDKRRPVDGGHCCSKFERRS